MWGHWGTPTPAWLAFKRGLGHCVTGLGQYRQQKLMRCRWSRSDVILPRSRAWPQLNIGSSPQARMSWRPHLWRHRSIWFSFILLHAELWHMAGWILTIDSQNNYSLIRHPTQYKTFYTPNESLYMLDMSFCRFLACWRKNSKPSRSTVLFDSCHFVSNKWQCSQKSVSVLHCLLLMFIYKRKSKAAERKHIQNCGWLFSWALI